MRLGTVIGRVTLTLKEPVYTGGRLLIVQPFTRENFAGIGTQNLNDDGKKAVFDLFARSFGGPAS